MQKDTDRGNKTPAKKNTSSSSRSKKNPPVAGNAAAKRTGGSSKSASRAAKNAKNTTAAAQPTAAARKGGRKKKAATPIRVTFLGGLNEIGKNMTMYECGEDAIIVDCGMAFPDDTMLGIDMVIPDITYLAKNIHKVRAILLTHGHEDHIGAIPYVLKEYRIPVYGTQLTLGLLEGKLREHNILSSSSLNVVKPGDSVEFGCIKA